MNLPALAAPPAHAAVALPLRVVPAGTPWMRVHKRPLAPVHFDSSPSSRFNAPDHSFGTLYVAASELGALAESVLRSRARVPPLVTARQLEPRSLTELAWESALRLVDLTGPGLVALGLDNRIASGADYGPAQQWARWFWSHPDKPDGLLYRSRVDPSQTCAALFSDRVSHAPLQRCIAESLAGPTFALELLRLLQHYGAELL